MIAPTDLAYLAGVLDAIGRFRVHTTAEGTRLPHVGISSPNLPLLRRCATLTGVKVTTVVRDYDRVGCGTHCDDAHLHVDSVTGRWQLVGYRATVVLAAVEPFLVDHRGQANDLLAVGYAADHKPQTATAMRRLGWPDPDRPR